LLEGGRIIMPAPKDPVAYERYRKNISQSLFKHYATHPETHEKIRAASTGRKHTEESKQKISATHKGEIKSLEHRQKISAALKGRNYRNGYIITDETKNKIRITLTGRKASEETKKKLSVMRQGEKCYWWRGGKSFEPYCPKFNRDLRRRVRAFFGNVCVNCGKTKAENRNWNMDVHHVNYDKMLCCNEVKPLFVTLCHSCHVGTTHTKDRLQWEIKFTKLIESEYNGKCYVEKT